MIKPKIDKRGTKKWYNSGGILHRIDGPAIELVNGDKYWYFNGIIHREDGPAIEYANGTKAWWFNNYRHREDGPAIEYASGTKYWYLNDKLHREDGPAIVKWDGTKAWWVNGERHREDGPAIERANGNKVWYFNGVRVPEWLVMTPSCDIDPKKLIDYEMFTAQQRYEFVRKVGIDRILKAFNAKIIESMGVYELLLLDIGNTIRPYLRMQNPSTNDIHIEGVLPSCTTIKQALNYRNGLSIDQIDDTNGDYLYQQGDIVLKPEGSTKFRSIPKILT